MSETIHYTKEQVENRISDAVCLDCGRSFLSDKQIEERKKRAHIVTCWTDKCGLCGIEKSVTHARAFNWLNHPNDFK